MAPEKPLGTRERLLRAAIEVFAQHGFEAATIRAICRRAGANVAAVNYHFGDKKRLYSAIFNEVFAKLREERTPFLTRNAPPESRLATYLRSIFEELFYCDTLEQDCAQLSAIYLMEMARPTEVLRHVVRDHIAKDAEELRDIVAQMLNLDVDSPTVINCAASIVGQVLYYHHARPLIECLHPELPPSEARTDELAQHVLNFSLGGLARTKTSILQTQAHAQTETNE